MGSDVLKHHLNHRSMGEDTVTMPKIIVVQISKLMGRLARFQDDDYYACFGKPFPIKAGEQALKYYATATAAEFAKWLDSVTRQKKSAIRYMMEDASRRP